MTSVVDVVLGISTPLKLAWVLWLVWAACQVAWYRRSRELVLPRMLPTPRRVRKPQAATGTAEVSETAPV